GDGPMELVQAPPLAELAELTDDFKVPSEPLAGFVQDDRKVFSTTIRPRKEGVAEIPAIPFTFFNPQQRDFVTVRSQPVSIDVAAAATLALEAIVGGRDAADRRVSRPGSEAAAFENSVGNDLLLNEAPYQPETDWFVLLFATPPLLVSGLWLFYRRSRLVQFLGRFGWGIQKTESRIKHAETPQEVCRALESYLSIRLGLATEQHDRAALVGALRTDGQHKQAVRCERVFQAIGSTYGSGGHPPASVEDVRREALEVLFDLRRRHASRPCKSSGRGRKSAGFERNRKRGSQLARMILAAGLISASVSDASAETTDPHRLPKTATDVDSVDSSLIDAGAAAKLTLAQRQTVLKDANALYQQASNATSDDSADAKQAFGDAAEKYQLLIDSGVANSRLYVNLANAYLQGGQLGKAIANYRRALAIDRTNRAAHANLRQALLAADLSQNPTDADKASPDLVAVANQWLMSRFSPRFFVAAGAVGWFALWLAVGLRLHGVRFPWKTAMAAGAAITIAAASISWVHWQSTDQLVAVVTSPSVSLREGDGVGFAASTANLSEGATVEVVKRRGDWLKVRSDAGQVGWIAARNVEVI
ncbi:MAG: SH3 domain-containing protein, partial [Planctomycetota bacterium]